MSSSTATMTSVIDDLRPSSLSSFSPQRTFKTLFRSPYHAKLLQSRNQTPCGDLLETSNGVSRWKITNETAKDWDNIRNELWAEFNENRGTIYESIPVHDIPHLLCWMFGIDEKSAVPYAVILHHIPIVANRAMHVARKYLDFKKYGFGVGYLIETFELFTGYDVGYDVALEDTIFTSDTCIDACGIGFKATMPSNHQIPGFGKSSKQVSTIGGVINLPPLTFYRANMVQGITVGHAFSDTPHILRTKNKSDKQNQPSILRSGNLYLSDSSERELVFESSSSRHEEEYKAVRGASLPKLKLSESRASPQSASFHANPALVGTQGDWATIENNVITNRGINRLDNLDPFNEQEQPVATSFVTEINLEPPEGDVIILTQRGQMRGRDLGKIYSMKPRKSIAYGDQWGVEISRGSLEPGDSGSWVIDARTGKLYGMLSAAILSLGIGRVIPARAIQYDLLAHDFKRSTSWDAQELIPDKSFPGKSAKPAKDFGEGHDPELYSEENPWSFYLLPSISDIYCTAARHGDVQVLRQIDDELSSQEHIDKPSNNRLPLIEACKGNRLEAATYIIQRGANPNASDGRHLSLIEAVKWKNMEICQQLLHSGADADAYDSSEHTSLSTAKKLQWTSGLEILLKNSGFPQPNLNKITSSSTGYSKRAESIFSLTADSVYSSETNQESYPETYDAGSADYSKGKHTANTASYPSYNTNLKSPQDESLKFLSSIKYKNYNLPINYSTQPPLSQVPIRSTLGKSKNIEPLYKVHHAKRFEVGKVFKILWSESKGINKGPPGVSRDGSRPLKYGEEACHSIRRFVIVKAMRRHCICVPVLTYEGQATTKPGVDPQHHAIVFTGKDDEVPHLLSGEAKLGLLPIRVDPKTPQDQLDPLSCINFGKSYTIEYNVRSLFIGSVNHKYMKRFLHNYSSIQKISVGFPSGSGNAINKEEPISSCSKPHEPSYEDENTGDTEEDRILATP